MRGQSGIALVVMVVAMMGIFAFVTFSATDTVRDSSDNLSGEAENAVDTADDWNSRVVDVGILGAFVALVVLVIYISTRIAKKGGGFGGGISMRAIENPVSKV